MPSEKRTVRAAKRATGKGKAKPTPKRTPKPPREPLDGGGEAPPPKSEPDGTQDTAPETPQASPS